MRSGDTPITRAACTYSLLRSTSVEPRTVRAYCTQPVSAIAMISTPKASVSCAFGKQRAADAGDQQRDQDRRERQHHVADAHDEGVEPAADEARRAGRARRRPAPTAAPTRRRRTARCARRTSAPTGCRGPGRRCRAGTWLPPSACQAGGRRASPSSSVARSNGLCGATTPANTAQKMQTKRDRRRADRHRRGAEAVPDVAVEEARRARSASRRPAPTRRARPRRPPRPPGRRRTTSTSTVIHLKNMKLSASCTSSTFLLHAQASACWCSGMWPTSSWWILKASRDHRVALRLVGLATGSSASARRPSGCCRRRG